MACIGAHIFDREHARFDGASAQQAKPAQEVSELGGEGVSCLAADSPAFSTNRLPFEGRWSGWTRTVCTAALCAGLLTSSFAPAALADESIDTDPTPDELQLRIEESAAALDSARERVELTTAEIAENEQRIAELEVKIPIQQERSAHAARELYKLQQQSYDLIDLLLNSEGLMDFVNNLEYINYAMRANMAEIQLLNSMKEELDASQQELETAKAQAESDAAEAERALTEAQELRLEAQRKAEEEARRAAEQAAAAQAAAQAATQSASESESNSDAETAATVSEASNAAAEELADDADWSSDEATFVAEWTGRIDAYLAGSPLAGYGHEFAVAAWNYGVDPRWSPAISCVESSKGAACFLSHNAWGWGSVSWDSWEEAIDSHVRGLARGYGYTVSIENARKYCPPNADFWYSRCVEEMNKI